VTERHPVHTLSSESEAARLNAVATLAATQAACSTDALRELATLQAALTAVREESEAHGVGWEVIYRLAP
jgi:hypothetical protein